MALVTPALSAALDTLGAYTRAGRNTVTVKSVTDDVTITETFDSPMDAIETLAYRADRGAVFTKIELS